MNTYRITYVNIAFSPRASHDAIEAHTASDALARFRERTNMAVVETIVGVERRCAVIDGRSPHGRYEWRSESIIDGKVGAPC